MDRPAPPTVRDERPAGLSRSSTARPTDRRVDCDRRLVRQGRLRGLRAELRDAARAHVDTATIDGAAAECAPPLVDLLVNAAPTRVVIIVPRQQLGDLVPEFGDETTL